MPFKKLLLIMSASMLVIVSGLLLLSYAWYSVAPDTTHFNVTTPSEPNIEVVYAQSDYINTTTGIPLASSSEAEKELFTVTLGNDLSSYNVAVEISLINININSSLKTSEFRYELYMDGASTPVGSGNFASIGSNTSLTLMSMRTLNIGTHTFDLRIWLQESGSSQNVLMNKSFSAKVKVASAYKK